MRFSFSTNAFTRYSVLEAVRTIAAIGYEGVELLADTPHLYAPAITDSDLGLLRNFFDGSGISVANINANTAMGYYGREFWEPLFEPSLANPNSSERRWRVDYTKKCIDMAHSLGSPCVSITSGRMIPGIMPEESLKLLTESLAEVLEYAMEAGIRIGIEYEPGLLIERYEELISFLDMMKAPNLGANLDLGHSNVLREDPEVVISSLSSRIFHIHLEDIKSHKHYHLVPGSGDMDFASIFTILEKESYEEFITFELYTYPHKAEEAARASLEYARRIIRSLH